MNKVLSPLRKAVSEYGMIKEGDKVCVGVSGGKDSVLLLVALKELSRFYPEKFEVCGYTVDSGDERNDFTPVSALCKEMNIEYHIEKTDISEIVFKVRKEENPCSLCASLRRGALCNGAEKIGANVLCLGHHFDDVIETFMMNLFNNGRISCFPPVRTSEKLRIIRPFIYLGEREISAAVKRLDLPVVKNPCIADGNTQREKMKEFLNGLEKENEGVKKRIFAALTKSGVDGWHEKGVTKGVTKY